MKATKEDWIILRLAIGMTKNDLTYARCSGDLVRSLLFLHKKLGSEQLDNMIDAIKGE